MAYVIGLDVGTTSTIGILIELPARVAGIASRRTELVSLEPAWAEQDPRQWWNNVCAITRELLDAEPHARGALAAVGVAGMVPAVVLLDERGALIRRSIQQSDGRCAREVGDMAREIDPEVFLRRTGNGLNQQVVGSKLRWVAKHEPDNFARVATVFGSYDFIAWELTGERGVEANWALEAGFVDLATGLVADDLVALAHVPRKIVPPMRRGEAVVGRVTARAAAASGIPEGTPVVAGAADHVASAFAAGVTAPGDVLLKFGGAGDILLATGSARPDARMFLDYHVVPGLFMPNGCMACTGSLLNWIVATIASGAVVGAANPHAQLDALADAVPAGANGVFVLPYFLGEKSPIHDASARGVVAGLSLSHGVADVWRAALEGTAYAFRHHLEVFREIGYPVTRLLASDGGSRSAVWMQVVADATQSPIQTLTSHPGSCLGAAWVAAMGVNAAADWAGVSRLVGHGRLFTPDRATAEAHDAGFRRFRELYVALAPWFSRP